MLFQILKRWLCRAAAFFFAVATCALSYSVEAADIGGDCCADLEERVAELEATTVRKGNRKVSVELSGHMHNVVMFWDDGRESNAYVLDNDHSGSRFRLKGNASISPGFSAGYLVEIQLNGVGDTGAVNQNDDNAGAGGPGIRHTMLYMSSEELGKVTIGRTSPALDDLTQFGGYLSWAQADAFVGGGFFLRRSDTGALTSATVSSVVTGFDESRRNIVRYDTPKIAGFMLSAAWGEDDYWDIALRFAKEVGDFYLHGAVGYNEDRDGVEDHALKAYGSVYHKPSGLFVMGSYTEENHEGASTEQDEDGYMIAAGVDLRLVSIGKTRVWGSHVHSNGDGSGMGMVATSFGGTSVTHSEANRWDVGVVQWIDPAALELFAIYSQYDFDIEVDAAGVPLEQLSMFLVGGRIKF